MSLNLTKSTQTCQANHKKNLRNNRYSTYRIKEDNKLDYQIQLALRDKVLKNEIGFILECFSGVRRRNLLKALLFLVTNSQHQFIRISHDRLSESLGISRDQARRYIRKLKEATFLTVISEQHTKKNKLPNMYQISPIFFQDNLKKQLTNMLYETCEFFHAPLNNILKEELNYNSISTQNIGSILFNIMQNKENLRSAYRVGANRNDSQCFEVDSSLRSERPERKGIEMKWYELSDEEKEKVLKFASGETRKDLVNFRDRKNNPEKFMREDIEAKPNKFMADYLQQFRSEFVKE